MHPSRAIRRSSLLLAPAVGLAASLALSGCGERATTGPVSEESKPTVTAKDSMDYYKKTKNIPNIPAKR